MTLSLRFPSIASAKQIPNNTESADESCPLFGLATRRASPGGARRIGSAHATGVPSAPAARSSHACAPGTPLAKWPLPRLDAGGLPAGTLTRSALAPPGRSHAMRLVPRRPKIPRTNAHFSAPAQKPHLPPQRSLATVPNPPNGHNGIQVVEGWILPKSLFRASLPAVFSRYRPLGSPPRPRSPLLVQSGGPIPGPHS